MILSDVIATLISTFDAALSVPVVDGPQPASVAYDRYVTVGATGEPGDVAVASLEPSGLGPGTWRDEFGSVDCAAWAWSGGTDIPILRAAALALAEQCLAAVWADRTLGGLLQVPGATTGEVRYEPAQTDKGAIVRATFTVAYQALVTT